MQTVSLQSIWNQKDAYKCYNCSEFLSEFAMYSLPTEQLMHHHYHL